MNWISFLNGDTGYTLFMGITVYYAFCYCGSSYFYQLFQITIYYPPMFKVGVDLWLALLYRLWNEDKVPEGECDSYFYRPGS